MLRYVGAVLVLGLTAVSCTTAVMPDPPGTVRLNASLTDGSLAGTTFQVVFTYDPSQVVAKGQVFLSLTSFDFTLLGVAFKRSDINEGGQVIFQDGAYQNVTASFQGVLPANSPVSNITFGFGGPGVIGYVDHDNQFGHGTFTRQK